METATSTTKNNHGKPKSDALRSRVDSGQASSDRFFSFENLVLLQASRISGSLEDNLYDVGSVCG